MNFLLHMIGLGMRPAITLRPSGSQRLRSAAAVAAMSGRLDQSLAAYRRLATETQGSLADCLIVAHLHLALCQYSSALTFFSAAIGRAGEPPCSALEETIVSADGHLRAGRYVRATALLQQGRGSVDTLLAAHAGLAVATARLTCNTACAPGSILPLAKLGDLLLRLLARTHLAQNLADSLRLRSLRHDLAPWATSSASIDHLLCAEFDHLQKQANAQPSHAELHHRLGQVARTLGKLPQAQHAFTRILSIHPHHLPSAARLAATQLQLGNRQAVYALLATAFAVSEETLRQYGALAKASQTETFDKAAARLDPTIPNPAETVSRKANLAFALGELGLLDASRAQWREPVAA